jgi:hypothetical protein
MVSWARLVAKDGERLLGGVARWEQKRREGGWRLMISCARATRGLRRMERERPGAFLARRTRTVKLCLFDARSKGQPWPLSYRGMDN